MASLLIIDDEPWMREIVRAILEAAGHRVSEAVDGESGIASLRADAVDAVLLDIRLPRMRVEEVVAGLRAARPGVPILLCTGLTRDMVDPALLALPRVGFLEKPFTCDDLEAELGRLGVAAPA